MKQTALQDNTDMTRQQPETMETEQATSIRIRNHGNEKKLLRKQIKTQVKNEN